MATARPWQFSQDFCRCLPVYVKTPLFFSLCLPFLGRNHAESRSALRCSWATTAFLCKREIQSGLNWRFLFTDEKLDLLMTSFSWATNQMSYLKHDFSNFALLNTDVNPSFLQLQDLDQYRVKFIFFPILCQKTPLYKHLNTMLIFNVRVFFLVLFIILFWVR